MEEVLGSGRRPHVWLSVRTEGAEGLAAMSKTVSEKMGLKAGTRAIFVNAPQATLVAIDPPALDAASKLVGRFDYIHLFVRTQAELDDAFPKLKAHLEPTGMLWVSWPKDKQLGTDLTPCALVGTRSPSLPRVAAQSPRHPLGTCLVLYMRVHRYTGVHISPRSSMNTNFP
jgi:hypothetical protein